MIELEESTADPQRLAMIREAWRQKVSCGVGVSGGRGSQACLLPYARVSATNVLCLPPCCPQFATAPQLTPEDLASDPELAEGAMHPDVSAWRVDALMDVAWLWWQPLINIGLHNIALRLDGLHCHSPPPSNI
jgi:hypothetical protein